MTELGSALLPVPEAPLGGIFGAWRMHWVECADLGAGREGRCMGTLCRDRPQQQSAVCRLRIGGQRGEGFYSELRHVFGLSSAAHRGASAPPADEAGNAGSHLELCAESQGPEKNKNMVRLLRGGRERPPGSRNGSREASDRQPRSPRRCDSGPRKDIGLRALFPEPVSQPGAKQGPCLCFGFCSVLLYSLACPPPIYPTRFGPFT